MQTATPQHELERDILAHFPSQGFGGGDEYLWMSDRANALVEYTDGSIEVLPMPTPAHQAIVRFVVLAFFTHLQPFGGQVTFAPLRIQIRERTFRGPDLVLPRDSQDTRQGERFWNGANQVSEVVSKDNPERDLVETVRDYAEARLPEYWIVNPRAATISDPRLDGVRHVAHGTFRRGERETSALLSAFNVDVSAALDAR